MSGRVDYQSDSWGMEDERQGSLSHTYKEPCGPFQTSASSETLPPVKGSGTATGNLLKKTPVLRWGVCCRWREWNIRSGRSGGDVKRTRSKQAELFVNHVWGRCSTCKHITLTSNQTNYMVLKLKTYYTFVQYGAQAQRCHEIKWKVEPKEM